MKIKIIIVIFFLILSAFPVETKEKEKRWKGRIEYENGVKVIVNPEEPLYGKLKFKLKKDLTIKGDRDYAFKEIRDVKVDRENNIFILDGVKRSIHKFNKNGAYLQTISTMTKESNASSQPWKLLLDTKSGWIYVMNYRGKIEVFNKEGVHIKDIHLRTSISDNSVADLRIEDWMDDIILEEDKTIWSRVREFEKENFFHKLCKVSQEGIITDEYVRVPYTISIVHDMGGRGVVSTWYDFKLFVSRMGDNHLIYGYSKEYMLSIINTNGDLILKIKKETPYILLSGKQKHRLKSRGLHTPEHEPLFYSLFTDTEGRIYVRIDTSNEYDIFSSDGYYLYKATLHDPLYEIRDGYLYTSEENRDKGEEIFVRWKINNWEQIREGL